MALVYGNASEAPEAFADGFVRFAGGMSSTFLSFRRNPRSPEEFAEGLATTLGGQASSLEAAARLINERERPVLLVHTVSYHSAKPLNELLRWWNVVSKSLTTPTLLMLVVSLPEVGPLSRLTASGRQMRRELDEFRAISRHDYDGFVWVTVPELTSIPRSEAEHFLDTQGLVWDSSERALVGERLDKLFAGHDSVPATALAKAMSLDP